MAPGHQYPEASTKESVKEKGPRGPFLNVYWNEFNSFYGFPAKYVRSYRTIEEKEILEFVYVSQAITKGDNWLASGGERWRFLFKESTF